MSTLATLEKKPATRGKPSTGFEMAEWSERQEDMMSMIEGLEHKLGVVAFSDRESVAPAAAVCACGRGGVNNSCNWAY